MNTRRNLLWIALGASLSGLACVASYPPGHYDNGQRSSPRRDGRYGYSNERFAALAHELDERAARAHQIAEGLSARNERRGQDFERIHHFSDQARAFHERYESGEINSRGRLREEIGHLLDDARATDDAMRRANVFPEVWNEWQGVVRVLQQMLDVVPA